MFVWWIGLSRCHETESAPLKLKLDLAFASLPGVLMPEAHSLSTLLKALKQHPSTPLKLVARASDLLRVVGLLHTDLSKDVRCRDMELFQEMWRDMADQ